MPSSRPENSEEPSGLLRILWSFLFGFFAWSLFSRPRSDKQQEINTIRQTGEAQNQERHQQISLNVTVRDTEEVIRERRADTDRQYSVQNSIRFAAWAAFIAASVYASISALQWRTAERQLELSERPWIKIVDLKTLGNDSFIPALSFQGFGHGPFPQGNKLVTFQIEVSMKNIGHSRALVSTDFEMFLPPWKDNFEDIILAEEKRFCDASAKKEVDKYLVRLVFPDEPLKWGGATVKPVSPMIFSDTLARNPQDPSGNYILPIVVVCSNYRFQKSTTEYQTRAMFVISHEPTGIRFFSIGEDVPERGIRISRDEMADDAY